jgi:hypothetical protein
MLILLLVLKPEQSRPVGFVGALGVQAMAVMRLRVAMAWLGCFAVVFAAVRTDAFATVLILAFPDRLAQIVRSAGLRVARRERRAAILSSSFAFLGDPIDGRRFVRAPGLSQLVAAMLVDLRPVWRETAMNIGSLATHSSARANASTFLKDWRMIARDLCYWRPIKNPVPTYTRPCSLSR